MENEDNKYGRWILFFVSWVVAFAAFFNFLSMFDRVPVQVVNSHLFGPETHDIENQIQFDPSMMWYAAGVGLVTLILWPMLGVFAVWIAEMLRDKMYPMHKVSEIEEDFPKTVIVAFWPIRLVYAIVVYPPMGVIRHLFPE